MRLIRFLACLSACLFTLPATAQQLEPVGEPIPGQGYEGPAFALTQVVESIELVRATREIPTSGIPRPSDLRVSLLVLDTGPSTDLSPTLDIQLALFNDIEEFGIAWALEPVTGAYGFERAERTGPGLYDVYAVLLNDPERMPDCAFVDARISVDARALSVAVRQAKGLGEFDSRRYTAPMPISAETVGCADR